MIYTSIDQSKHLIELGLSPESADAFYMMGDEPVDIVPIYGLVTHQHLREQMAYKRAVPCWSVGALLEVMPEGTELNKITCEGTYQCCNLYHYSIVETAINVCYEMTCWLLKNGYINKNK